MSAITDANFTYSVVSTVGRTLAIVGINPSNATYSASNANWGAFPAIPAVYAGSNTAYNGNGVPANAFKVAEIGANAFDSLAEYNAFAETILTAAFLPANLKRIGDRAFAGIKLKGSLTIPATLDSVGFQAFHETLVTDIVIGSSTNSTIVAHLANLTSVIQQEINDRGAADASLNALKAPIDNATFTGTATIPTASIGTATIGSASIAAATINVANLASASFSAVSVIGNAAFGGTVAATGEWNFTTHPQYNSNALATEPFLTSTIGAISNFTSSMETLTSLKTEMGPDTAFATKLFNSHVSISAALSTETSLRSSAVSSLASALSTSVSSLAVVDSALQIAMLAEPSTRVANASDLTSTLIASVSSLVVVDSALQSGLLSETGTRVANLADLNRVLGEAVTSLAAADAALSTAVSTEISTHRVAVDALTALRIASVATLDTADAALNAALSTETSQRVLALTAIVPLQSSAFAATDFAQSTALAGEVSTRASAIASLSQSVTSASVAAHTTTAHYSIALVTETAGRSAAISSLSSSVSASVSALASTNTSLTAALSAEGSSRSSAVSLATDFITATNAAADAANAAVDVQLAAETSVRTSQIASISLAASVAGSSIAVTNSAILVGLANEVAARSGAISAAIANVLNGAPSRMNTLEKIAAEISANPSLTITSSTIAKVSGLTVAVASETSARISAVASLSNTAIPSLSAVDAGLINALSTETSNRGTAVASLMSALSDETTAFAVADGALSGSLSLETIHRASTLLSVSTAVTSVAATLTATGATLGAALSTEIANRQIGVTSIADAMQLSVASLNSTKTALITALSAEVLNRGESVASVSGEVASTYASLQTADNALKTNVAALSSALALKATTAYLDGRTSALLNGAPDNLNTLVEMAAALGNNPSFASSITTALSVRAGVADATALSVAIASKATLTELTTLATAVSSKAANASISTANTSLAAMNNTVTAFSSIISTLAATGGTVNGSEIQVSGVTIPILATRIQELYYHLGTINPSWGAINPDGTINYKLNRLANPTLVSGTLAFEYDAGGAVNKVKHAITVQFDSAQKSVTVTGGVGTPTTTVNNMVLDASNRYAFRIDYAGSLSYYQANKTAVSIVALETPYKLAPSAPTVTAPALDAGIFVFAAPTIVANSKTVSKSGSTYTYTATFTNAGNAVMEVLNAANDTVAAVQPTINAPYAYTYDSSKIGSAIFKIRVNNTASMMASPYLVINGDDIPPVLSNFTLGARAIGAIVLPQPTTTAPVTYTANTYNPVGQRLLFTNVKEGVYQRHSTVNISPDGTKIVIGGIGGNSSGIVRVYSLDSSTNTWTQIGGDILGDTVNGYAGGRDGKALGFNVISMSADATLVVTAESGLGNQYYENQRLNIFKYDPSKNSAQSNSALPNFGPARWSRISTLSTTGQFMPPPQVALSADGKTMAVLRNTNLIVYNSTNGGVTWTQMGSTLTLSAPYLRSVHISANGLQVLVATDAVSITPGALIVYEWNGNNWTSTTIRDVYNGNFEMAMSSDGKVVVSVAHGADNSFIRRSHKTESGAWINNAYQFSHMFRTYYLNLSADGSVLLICRERFNYDSSGDIEIYRWNGTEYVAVIANRSLTNRGITYSFNAMLTADGTRFIVGHEVANADVYDLAASSKFGFSTSNSDVAEVYGNLALLKTTGSSTITATQITATGNATIASELTVVNTGIVSSGTLTLKTSFGGYGTDNTGFYMPTGVAIDASGNMVIADMLNARVKVHSTTNNQFLSQFGTNGSGDGQFLVALGQGPRGVATFMNGNMVVVDTANNRMQVFSKTGTFVRKFGSAGSGDSQFSNPRGIAVDHRNNNILVAETGNNRIQVFSETGTFIRAFGSFGTGNGQFKSPNDVATDMNGTIYVADSTNNRIQVFSEMGVFIRTFGSLGTGNGQFNRPYSIATDAVGKIIVVDANNNRIQVFQNDGAYVTGFSSGLEQPEYVAVNASGSIVLANPNSIFIIG
jgi:DNA-binding beta-propeller fold protein YncE